MGLSVGAASLAGRTNKVRIPHNRSDREPILQPSDLPAGNGPKFARPSLFIHTLHGGVIGARVRKLRASSISSKPLPPRPSHIPAPKPSVRPSMTLAKSGGAKIAQHS
jgi:hypothetical protein